MDHVTLYIDRVHIVMSGEYKWFRNIKMVSSVFREWFWDVYDVTMEELPPCLLKNLLCISSSFTEWVILMTNRLRPTHPIVFSAKLKGVPAITWSKSVNAFWEITTMDPFLAFCPDHEKNKLTSKKVYKLIPSIWPTFLQIHQRELLKLHFDMLLSFSLYIVYFTEIFMVSLNLYLKFFFSRQKFLIKDQFEFGINPHEVLECFRRYSKIKF